MRTMKEVEFSTAQNRLSKERTLRRAVLDRIMSLKVQNDFLSAVVGNRCAKSFVHLVYLGFPRRSGEWRLHGDVAGAVTGVAVNSDLLAAIPGGEICTGHWVG